jgi:hypothetical protein
MRPIFCDEIGIEEEGRGILFNLHLIENILVVLSVDFPGDITDLAILEDEYIEVFLDVENSFFRMCDFHLDFFSKGE